MSDFDLARHNMVESQIRTNKVTDPAILDAFETIPRHLFVPPALRAIAHVDEDLPLGDGRYLMEPMVLARLLQAALPDAADVALDIGPASGYSTAILSRLVATVVGLEADGGLVAAGNDCLARLELDNAALVEGDMQAGLVRQAPFDLILFGGAIETVPDAILDQMADAGRLVAVMHPGGAGPGRATVIAKAGGTVSRRVVFDANIPLLPGFRRAPAFVF